MDARQREAFFRCLQAIDPEPETELVYGSDFELLIAVMLSAQSTDKAVNKATAGLFAVANTPEAMLALGEERLREHIKTIGLYNSKARNILATCAILRDRHDGCVPASREALESLPGVGRKTANVVLNIAFGKPTIAVDTHIFRVANRTGLAPGSNVREVEQALLRAVPEAFRRHAHHWLILLGRYTCTARRPRCSRCPVRDLCEFPDKTDA